MQLRSPLLLGAIALTLALLFVLVASAWSPEAPSLPHDQAQVQAALHRAPLLFIQNAGQFAPQARFQVRGGLGGGSLWLADDALWITLVKPPSPPAPTRGEGGEGQPPAPSEGSGAGGEGLNLRLRFLGANPQPRLEPFRRLETHVSYFLGHDPAKWRADVPVWGGVRYVGLYPGVDLELSGAGGRWGWRLLVGAGADLSAVRLSVEGAEEITLEGEHLRLSTAIGAFSLPPLLAGEGAIWQPVLVEGGIAFAPPPVRLFPLFPASGGWPEDDLLYSTFLGGSREDWGYAIALDGSGAATVTGYTYSSDFPTTPGAFDPSHDVFSDAFVTKLTADGSGLVYSTFLGGSSWDWGSAIALDGAGAATVTGGTKSSDFPTTPGAFDPTCGCDPANYIGDAFVTKLTADGSGLVYSTFLGGGGDDWGSGIALDGAGAATVTGYTDSSDFPTTPGAFDPSFNGGDDAYVTRLNAAGSGLVYSTFLGGSGWDEGWGIALDGAGAATVTGGTYSSDFPTTPGAFDPSFNGVRDAFVTRLRMVLPYQLYLPLILNQR